MLPVADLLGAITEPKSNSFVSAAPVRNRDTLLGSHADIHRVADRRPERRVHAGKQDKVTDFDLEIQAVAEKGLGEHRPRVKIVAIGRLLRLFRQLDILGPHRHHDRVVRCQALDASHVEVAQRGANPAATLAATRKDDGIEKVRGADEIGDEPVARAHHRLRHP